jgi:hypothetical protein
MGIPQTLMDSARTLLIPSLACAAAVRVIWLCARRSDLFAIDDKCLRNRQEVLLQVARRRGGARCSRRWAIRFASGQHRPHHTGVLGSQGDGRHVVAAPRAQSFHPDA